MQSDLFGHVVWVWPLSILDVPGNVFKCPGELTIEVPALPPGGLGNRPQIVVRLERDRRRDFFGATEPGGNRSIRWWPISAAITRSTGTGGPDGHSRLTSPVGSGVTWFGATPRWVLENSLVVRLGVDGECAAGHSGRDPHLRQARLRPGALGRPP